MKRDLTPEQLAQPVNLTLPLGAVLRLAETEPYAAVRSQDRAAYSVVPAIGANFKDGMYAGLTVFENDPHELVLLPGDFKGPWEKAKAWAAELGGVLPSRVDALILYKNLKPEFKEEYYWTSEEYTGDADGAWVAAFSYGYQATTRKGDASRCRAVRRVAI